MIGESDNGGLGTSRAVAEYRRARLKEEAAVGVMPSSDWESYEPALFRLAGFGGSALFLRASVLPDERGAGKLGIDMALLSPEGLRWLFNREVPAGLSAELARFFIAVAGQAVPELTVGSFGSGLLGFECQVVASDLNEVEFLVTIDADQELPLRTTRAAVMQAALDVRRLEDVNDHRGNLDVPDFPSPDWF